MRYFFYILMFFLSFGASVSKADLFDLKALKSDKNSVQLLTEGLSDTSPISDKKGIGQWVLTDYGQIRLIAGDSGTDNLKLALFGLQVELKQGAYLKTHSLKLTQSENAQNARFFTPVLLPLQPDKGLIYNQDVVFPFLLDVSKSGALVHIQLQFTATYCFDNQCALSRQSADLQIPAGYNFYTVFNSYLKRSLDFTANPATADEIKVGAIDENTLWIKVKLERNVVSPELLILNADDNAVIPYQITQSDIQKKQAFFVIRTTLPIMDKKTSILLYTNKQMLIQTTDVKKAPIPAVIFDDVQPNKLPFYCWILFLIISPVWSLLLRQQPRNEIVARTENLKNLILIPLGILCAVPMYLFFPYAMLSNSILWSIFGIALFGALGYFSYNTNRFAYGVLTGMLPLFIFFETYDVIVPTSVADLLYFFSIIAILNVLPFVVLFFKPLWSVQIARLFKYNNNYALRFVFFLDGILFVYLLLSILL